MGLPGVEAYVFRGIALAIMKKPALAEKDYDKAIHLDPDNAAAYVDRGLALENLGQINLAKEDHKQACKLDRKFC